MVINASRLASLGEMAGGMAHEINNPLTIISGNCEILSSMLESGNLDPEKFNTGLKSIHNTLQRIAKIIQGLRVFARGGNSEELTHCSPLISSLTHLLYARKNLKWLRLKWIIASFPQL